MTKQVVVITGAGAGVGRATAREFANKGCDVGLIGRDRDRLDAAAEELQAFGVRTAIAVADVADEDAVEAAADSIEAALGPITVWVNNAMATVFSPVAEITGAEFRRATEVTYLGTVFGTMAALRRMRRRGSGTIVNVGSALAYRSVPLQAAYCGAKSAIRGFTDSLRSEILHDGDAIYLTMVHLPAINTPQFSWALNRTGQRAQPVPPIYEPEIAARAIVFAAFHHRREIWVGFSTVRAILANRVAAGLADRYLARAGYSGQMMKQKADPDAPNNLYESVPGAYAAHGNFDDQARTRSYELFTSRHKLGVGLLAAGLIGLAALRSAVGKTAEPGSKAVPGPGPMPKRCPVRWPY
ncbi:SDR family oxidoreductase [Lichenicoccus roseus]|uniref:SDR family oxidoreductase n=1 Tax=Lichenicoccus roseus TaxID=2683649 RepID=A0A5R9JBV6_9PROT|nr:SDR family oxidoreductase [Lichenicoccus roseus]TLU73101.1 SDR family oxidoreductase [Lichenicoccus roseus]